MVGSVEAARAAAGSGAVGWAAEGRAVARKGLLREVVG